MLDRFLPRRLDNDYQGRTLALWIFAIVVALKTAQGLVVILNGWSIAQSADGIPLGTYPPGAAQTVVALFVLTGLYRLALMVVSAVALVRYRSAVPLFFAVLVAQYLAGLVLSRLHPIERVGVPPGPLVNRAAFVATVIGLALSLWPRRHDAREAAERPPQRSAGQ